MNKAKSIKYSSDAVFDDDLFLIDRNDVQGNLRASSIVVEGDLLPYWSINPPVDEHYLFDLSQDPAEENNLAGQKQEQHMQELLHVALKEWQAPVEQAVRLGLA